MQIKIYPDYHTLSENTGSIIADYLKQKPDSVICLASGNTPVPVFHWLVNEAKAGRLHLDHCTFVALDEWAGIEPTSPGSCRNMMDRDLFRPLSTDKSHIKFFDGMAADLQRECDIINDFIDSKGGLDIMLVGIGLNGHIAMNEPGTPFDRYAHVSELSEETKIVGQKYFKEKTKLSKGLTLGLRHLAESKLPILMANGKRKAPIISKALKEPASLAVPASIIQTIPAALVLLDAEAASLI